MVAVSIGGPGADTFVFTPGVGTDVITNFSGHGGAGDHIELDNFQAQNFSELQALMHPANNGHDTVIDLGHGDGVTIAGVAPSQLHASDFVFHHAAVA
jgi:hypothetical protein